MKTSKILTAMVLPAMLAACTAEDIVTNGANNMVQSERPLLSEDFRLISEGEGQGVDSRFYMAGSSILETVWEDGDKYGAALIDQYDPEHPRNPEEWDVIYSLAGNTPFIYDGATEEWKAVAATGVGHYLFSFPYNIKDQNRAAVSWELPAIQELYGEDGKLDLEATINKSNKSVAAALLKENATSHSLTMRNLFSYPKFVVKFDNGLPITTVSQVVLEKADDTNFMIKGGFDHKKVDELFDTKVISDAIETDKLEDEKAYWATKQTADFIISDGKTTNNEGETVYSSAAASYTEFAYSKYIVAKLPENTKVKLDNDNNKCVEVRFMIPGELLEIDSDGLTGNYDMHIYTNNGVYTIEDVASWIDFKSTTPAETKKRVFARNASYTLNLTKDAPEKGDELYIVTDVKDWNELVSKYGASTAYAGVNALDIAVVGKDFVLDATAKMPTKADFAVTTDITIDGNVTLQNVFVEENKVIVKKGATLNIADNTNDINLVENYGTLNFKKSVASRAAEVVEMINTVDYVHNMPNATLNIEKDAEADFYLYNKYDDETLEYGKVYNNGVLKTNGNNDGEIENNGTTIIDGGFITWFKHTIGVYGEESYKEHTPAFFNNGVFVADGATYENKGNFINAATGNVSCAGGATGIFANNGYAKATKEGTFLITSNTGTIELDEINQAKWSLETMGGTILYVAKSTDTSLDFSSSAVTKLVIGDQNMTITKTNKLNAVEMGKGTLTLPKYDATAKNATTGINNTELNGSLTLKGDAVIASESAYIGGKLTIEEDASLTINKNNKVYAATTSNAGAVLVAGTFETGSTNTEAIVNDAKGNALGVFKSTQGSTNNIKFADPDADKKTAMSEALEALVTAWIDNSGTPKSWADVTLVNIKKTDFGGEVVDWADNAGEGLVDAYNSLNGTNHAQTDARVDAILDSYSTEVGTLISTAKTDAADALETAITTAIANKQLSYKWKGEVGYAYVAEVEEVAEMWTEYAKYLLANVATWTVENEDEEMEEVYKNEAGNLKNSLKFAIAAGINDAIATVDAEGEEKEATIPTLTIPTGSFIDASDKTAANYIVMNTYVNYTLSLTGVTDMNYDRDVNVELENVQKWCFELNRADEEDLSMTDYKAKQAIKDYVSTVLGWAAPVYSDLNLEALALLLDVKEVDSTVDINAAIQSGKSVRLAENVSGDGLVLNGSDNNVVIDLNGYTLDVSGEAVGSTGTETLGMQLLKGNIVTIKNGTIKATSENVKMLIQNYADLTLDNVKLVHNHEYGYALSNNNGNVTINNCEITVKTGKVAMDVYNYSPYSEGAHVVVKGKTTINGDIEYGADNTFNSNTWVSTLKFEGDDITLNGKLKGDANTTSNGRWPYALANKIEGEKESWLQ